MLSTIYLINDRPWRIDQLSAEIDEGSGEARAWYPSNTNTEPLTIRCPKGTYSTTRAEAQQQLSNLIEKRIVETTKKSVAAKEQHEILEAEISRLKQAQNNLR